MRLLQEKKSQPDLIGRWYNIYSGIFCIVILSVSEESGASRDMRRYQSIYALCGIIGVHISGDVCREGQDKP